MNLMQSLFKISRLRIFIAAASGNVMMTFALLLIPIMGAVGGAVDYSSSNSAKSSLQSALDATALAMIKLAPTLSSAQLQDKATAFFNATFNRPNANNVQVTAQYDKSANIVTVTGAASVNTAFMKVVGINQLNVNGLSKATAGARTWQVCVMVTDPDSNHTLLVRNQAKIEFTNCMVQVNTQNWDAVEARDTSYIHSTNGENCFVGDIHYGDVQPPKNPSCTFFPDPFASYTVPTNPCTYTNMVVNTPSATLTPGTYCGGITLNTSGTVTFAPGVYYIQDGDFKILGSVNVNATQVTFLITGAHSNIDIQTTGTITMSPSTNAGQWSGFVFYYDQPSSKNNKANGGKNTIARATVNMSGVVYLVGQILNITNGATVTVNPGSILADFILPDSASLYLTGSLNSSLAILRSLYKVGTTSGPPVLVQ